MNENDMKLQMESDKLEYWLNSFGGCLTNYLYKYLNKNNLRLNSNGYHKKGCHYIKPVNIKTIKMGVFCYIENLEIALTSQINRDIHIINYKKLQPKINVKFSITKWFDLIEQQIDNWTVKEKPFPVLVINMDKIWDNEDQLKKMFNIETILPPKKQRTSNKVHKLLKQYNNKIQEINNKLKLLPDFQIM